MISVGNERLTYGFVVVCGWINSIPKTMVTKITNWIENPLNIAKEAAVTPPTGSTIILGKVLTENLAPLILTMRDSNPRIYSIEINSR